jgi:hypothetical protein
MTVREVPTGSGINGRPILDDGLKHVAFYRTGAWWTWCGQRVPDDHMCPSLRERDQMRQFGPLCNCETCHRKYLAERR